VSRHGPGPALALAMALLLVGMPGAFAQEAEPAADAPTDLATDAEPAARPYNDLRRITPISGDAARGQAKAELCSACHGPDGISVVPMYPNLAGQRADYQYWQLVKLKFADEGTSIMTPIASQLSDEDMRDLSVYYAGLDPAGASAEAEVGIIDADSGGEEAADPAILALGEQLYRSGGPDQGIPPCQACHGSDARGHPRPLERDAAGYTPYAVYPVLRGQRELYLVTRLGEYRDGKYHSSTTDFIMNDVGHRLDGDSIQALSAWLSSLSD